LGRLSNQLGIRSLCLPQSQIKSDASLVLFRRCCR
jgi:hypothetical protein